MGLDLVITLLTVAGFIWAVVWAPTHMLDALLSEMKLGVFAARMSVVVCVSSLISAVVGYMRGDGWAHVSDHLLLFAAFGLIVLSHWGDLPRFFSQRKYDTYINDLLYYIRNPPPK